MYIKLTNIIFKTLITTISVLTVLLPLFCYKLNIHIEILPAIEIILVFYLCCYINLRSDEIFILGILFDQLYNMPVGTNSLALIIGFTIVKLLNKRFLIKEYLPNFLTLCSFTLIVTLVRFIVIYSKNVLCAKLDIFIMYYLTTVFSYPLLKVLFDKIFFYLKTNYVKQ